MAYDFEINAPGMRALLDDLEEARQRTRAWREERDRTNAARNDGAASARQQMREDAEAHRQRIRQRRIEEQEEDRARRKRWRDDDREEAARRRAAKAAADPHAPFRRLVDSTRLNLGPFSPLIGDLRRAGVIKDSHLNGIVDLLARKFGGGGPGGR